MLALPGALLTVASFLASFHYATAALRTYNLTIHAGSRAPDGFTRDVYLINGQQPGPLIEIEEGDQIEVFVKNELSVENTIHWHGLLQRGTPDMDGVPGVSQYAIPAGSNFTYKFSVKDEYGIYWYHSHFRAYYDDAVRGALLIHPSPSRARPFKQLASDSAELNALLQAERSATPVLLTDWTHLVSDAIYSQYMKTGAFPNCADSLLANGRGRVQCLPNDILQAGPGLGLDTSTGASPSTISSTMATSGMAKRRSITGSSMAASTITQMEFMASSSSMSSRSTMPPVSTGPSSSSMMGGMKILDPRGCTPPMMFRPGYDMGSLPPSTCQNTTSDLLTISANTTQGWLALHLVNAASVAKMSVSLDAHSMYVYAADGLFVALQKVEVLQIAVGQRYSVMIKLDQAVGDYYLRFATYPWGDMQQVMEGQAIVSYSVSAKTNEPFPLRDEPESVWMLMNGSAKANTSQLDTTLLNPFELSAGPPSAVADVTKSFMISQTGIVTWVIDNYPYEEADVPIVFGNSSDGWLANTTYHLPFNSTIDIIMNIAKESMDTMGHPMHLHGHKFWVLGAGSGTFPYSSVTDAPMSMINLMNPPYRDTTELPASGWTVIRYVSDNPGAWLLHCHVQWHLISGMGVVLVEGEDQLPGLLKSSNVSTAKPGAPSSSGSSGSAAAKLHGMHSMHSMHRFAIAVFCATLFLTFLLTFSEV